MKILNVTFPASLDADYLDNLRWKINTPFMAWIVPEIGPMFSVTIPIGFVTNLASVPRPFWSLFPPEGRYTEAAALHDYLYSLGGKLPNETLDKPDCDACFLAGMKTMGVKLLSRRIMWLAVRVFGAGAFKANQ